MKNTAGKKIKSVTSNKKSKKSFPVVAIGASLGGLKAVSELFQNLPSQTGMAFIYVQHLSATHKSFLTSILAKTTGMQVQEIDDMELMKPDNVYVMPYNRGIKVTNGHIKLVPRSKGTAPVSIDILFSSLADTHKKNVIGILLSGNGKDGSLGLKAIQEAGGMTMAQNKSAQAPSMPESAIASGVVDLVLSPSEMAKEIIFLSKNGLKLGKRDLRENSTPLASDPDLRSIYKILYEKVGVDFSHYKTASIKRRLHHQMQQSGIQTLKEYQSVLEKSNKQPDLLFKSLLINVTSFFRDAEGFKYLKSTVLPKLLKTKKPGESLRIWVTACSSGEEAYSVAMIIAELQANRIGKIPVQIFATDLCETEIHNARTAEYKANDLVSVSRDRIKKYFIKVGNTYRVTKEIREMCVFAPHNILSDPPFGRIDLVTCRNLLIYFDAYAQKKVLATLHFALNEGGVLMLGKSETTGSSSHLFMQVSNKFKIYALKKHTGTRKVPELMPRFPGSFSYGIKNMKQVQEKKQVKTSAGLDNAIDAMLLSEHMPACAVINKEMEILQFRGSTSFYLSHSSGKASLNIFKMMRPEFSFELRNAIQAAFKTKQTVVKSGIEIKIPSGYRIVTIKASPIRIDGDEPLLLIVFSFEVAEQNENTSMSGANLKLRASVELNKKVKKLTIELANARTEMQSVMDSQETAYEELQIANEEIVSSNEEFQTLNEELETSKEEIEATNEELISTNQELHIRNELLSESYNYAEAIVATIHEPLVVLDERFHVKSASKSFYRQFHTSKEETEGISFFELGNKQWDLTELHTLLKDVVNKKLDFDNFEVTHAFPGIGERIMLLNAHRIVQKNHREHLTLLAIDDITERSQGYLKEKARLKKHIVIHQEDKLELTRAVKRRTKQLELKNQELEYLNQELTSFNYVSSHDLQEPLRKIKNFIAVLLEEEKGRLSEEGQNYLNKTYETAEQMRMLIEDLLKYSRTRKGEHVFEFTDMNVLMAQLKDAFEYAVKSKALNLMIADMPKALVVPYQVTQVFQNLVSNSLKFSKVGRPLKVSIKSDIKLGDKLNKLSNRKSYCHIIYTDNGIGFDPKFNSRIFEVFQRLHTASEYAGTGIGLAICKSIMNNHRGSITATGTPGVGCRFDIYFPVD